jgi:hypothetical protein
MPWKFGIFLAKARECTNHDLVVCLYRGLVELPRLDLHAAKAAITKFN